MPCSLGLTPQAMNLSPLRGLTEWRPVPFWGLTPQAMNLSPLRGLTEWRPVPFWGLTPQVMNLSPLPASCFALRRDRSRLARPIRQNAEGSRSAVFFKMWVGAVASALGRAVGLLEKRPYASRIVTGRNKSSSGLDQPLPEAGFLVETADGGAELVPVSGQKELAAVTGLEAVHGLGCGDDGNAPRPRLDDLHADTRGDAQGNHQDRPAAKEVLAVRG